jgi:hypothetical protein
MGIDNTTEVGATNPTGADFFLLAFLGFDPSPESPGSVLGLGGGGAPMSEQR